MCASARRRSRLSLERDTWAHASAPCLYVPRSAINNAMSTPEEDDRVLLDPGVRYALMLASGARMQAVPIERLRRAAVGLSDAEYMHQLSAEPTRDHQRGNGDYGDQHRNSLADAALPSKPEVDCLHSHD